MKRIAKVPCGHNTPLEVSELKWRNIRLLEIDLEFLNQAAFILSKRRGDRFKDKKSCPMLFKEIESLKREIEELRVEISSC